MRIAPTEGSVRQPGLAVGGEPAGGGEVTALAFNEGGDQCGRRPDAGRGDGVT